MQTLFTFLTNEKTRNSYAQISAGTRQVLPARGDNSLPNLLHLFFHALFLATFVLVILLQIRS
jgi:hypothetical protein